MKLVVDIGNSWIKWGRVYGERLEPGTPVARKGPGESIFDAAWHNWEAPTTVLVSSVAGAEFDSRLELWMVNHWGCRPGWFRSRPETLGIVNGYSDYNGLGSDRWAAIIAARGLYPGALGVIDCGTAVTLDVIDKDDHHLGGFICPGIELAQHTLLTQTANICETTLQSGGLPGKTTAECVMNGIGLGLAGALERWIANVEKAMDGVTWIATGGDWRRLSPIVRKQVQYDADLVLKGLVRVLE
ncbi:MAG: Type III pantothenate kinase [Gammaproteobacteria bacterium]|nr:Type III pantothenate kinase [Gammaproteobacteria bacterium]